MAKPKRIFRVTVDEVVYEADVNRLTWAEAEAIEDKAGASMAEIMQTKSVKSVRALVWAIMKRGEPTLKFDDLLHREISDYDIEEVKEDEEEADPTVAATPVSTDSGSSTSEDSPKS